MNLDKQIQSLLCYHYTIRQWMRRLSFSATGDSYYNGNDARVKVFSLTPPRGECYDNGMRYTPKPICRCNTCLLNLGATCWKFACPRREWERGRCPGFDNEALYRQFHEWQEAPHVKTAKQLRRETFRPNSSVTRAHHFRKAVARHR